MYKTNEEKKLLHTSHAFHFVFVSVVFSSIYKLEETKKKWRKTH